MNREPGGKAQLAAAIVALVSYLLQVNLHIVPALLDLLVPFIAYAATNVAGWLWARQFTTPIADPVLEAGTPVQVTVNGKPTGSRRI